MAAKLDIVIRVDAVQLEEGLEACLARMDLMALAQWIASCRHEHADDRAFAEVVDVGGEA